MTDIPLPDVGNLTATAILGWYAWHTASKTIPGLLTSFREEMAAHREELRANAEAFRNEMTAERERRYADSMAIVRALDRLSNRLALLPESASLMDAPGGEKPLRPEGRAAR